MEPIKNKPNKDINQISTSPKKKIILTGDRPTDKLHIGHYVGSLKRRVKLQNSGQYGDIFIMIADTQALTDNADNPEKVRQDVIEVVPDYLSCGLGPSKSTLFIQSQIPELTELTFYYVNPVTVFRTQRDPTVKSKIKVRNFEANIPVGFFVYPISQAANITALKATAVPVSEDQLPMIEQTREIVCGFDTTCGEALVELDILLPDGGACLRLPGTDGKTKMNKPLGDCIYLSGTSEDVKRKVMSMSTDPSHLRVEDPGQVEGNPVFIHPDAFCNNGHFAAFWPGHSNLDGLKTHYMRGGLDDVKVKRFLGEALQAELRPIRARRKESEKDISGVYEILRQGSLETKGVAAQILSGVKSVMKTSYFEDTELINSQIEKFGE